MVNNQRGQMATEMILLLALIVAIFVSVSAIFRDQQYLAMFVSRPWSNIAAMIQNGVWDPSKQHPAHYDRWVSVKGDPP